MTRHPTTVPIPCRVCGERILLPVMQVLVVGNLAQVKVERAAMDEHLMVHAAERILEGVE